MARIPMYLRCQTLLVLALLSCWTAWADPVPFQITEFLAINGNSIRDEDGESSDWIEIHNPGTTVEFLDGWYLTDDQFDLTKWRFPPGVEMQPNAFRVIFASDKNRTNVLRPLHTNFKLSSGGEYLALVDPMTNVVSEFAPAFPTQYSDVSYGRDVGDPALLVYYQKPTPGERNVTGGAGFAAEVIFSRNSGTFPRSEPFHLTLSTFSSNAVIYYAFGTNVPGANTNIGRYTNSILISNSTIVRARSFESGLLPGPINSQSYIALANDVLNFSSDLPLMIVHNFGQGEASLLDQSVAVQTFEPRAGRSFLGATPAHVERARFHIRGNSSVGEPKDQFFIEIQDEFGADKESELLGLPEESDWTLYAPYRADPPMMHNPLAYQIMRDFGRYAPRTRYVELFLKDDLGQGAAVSAADYHGVYVLTEKIKRDNNRVAIDGLEPEHLAEPEITGGYIFGIYARVDERPVTFGGVELAWISPRSAEMTNVVRRPQVAYISNYFAGFTNVLASPQGTNGGYAPYIDTDSWIDYHIHQVVLMNTDALYHSTYFHKPRLGRITFGPPWDFDRSQGLYSPNAWALNRLFEGPPWWSRLFRDPNFWQIWIDRYQELREKPLSTNSIFAHIDRFASQVQEAQLRDQTRWGTSLRTGTRSFGSFAFNFGNTPSYAAEVAFLKVWYSNRFDFLDTNFLARPVFTSSGGWIEPGLTVTISPAAKPGTSLLYTLDGTDPRLPGGSISPLAQSNIGPVTITVSSNVCIAARSYNLDHTNSTGGAAPILSSPWSGLRSAGFFVSMPPVRITEIMYHPASSGTVISDEEYEYIELTNTGLQPLDLKRFKLRGAVDFDFPSIVLQAGAAAVVVANPTRFALRYGSNAVVAGTYQGRLDNAGERLVLLGPCDQPILDFRYDDEWYPITDGFGFSLVIVDSSLPVEQRASPSNWRPSRTLSGSPGFMDPPPPAFPPVVVNELLSRTDFPPPYDTVELHNPADSPVDIGGWFLTDDYRSPKKYRIPSNTRIDARGFVLFDERQFNSVNASEPFSFSSLGDEVYLFSADTNGNLSGYLHGFDFGPQENGVTFGRHIISTGVDHFPIQSAATLGSANAYPKVGPIVISEINYHPVDVFVGGVNYNDTSNEYIELHNASSAVVRLYDQVRPTNAWHLNDAVEFTFPPNTSIPPGGYLIVVSFNPLNLQKLAAFTNANPVTPGTQILGPWQGALDNAGERVELRRPGRPEPNGVVPSILVERISYDNTSPWPDAADGIGPALQRVSVTGYGNEPTNWIAAGRSPGAPYEAGPPPALTSNPADLTVIAGETAQFTIGASGTPPLSYQWRRNGQPISGGILPTLTLSNVQTVQAGTYDCIVLNAAGSMQSSGAVLTVLVPVEITLQPTDFIIPANNSTNYGKTGSNIVFRVIARSEHPPVQYQWRKNGDPVPGASSANFTINQVDLSHEGSYDVVITDAVSQRTSRRARLTVSIRPFFTEPHLLSHTVAVGSQVTLRQGVRGHPLPLSNYWRRASAFFLTNTVSNFVGTLTLSNVQLSDAAYYNVAAGNALGTNTPSISRFAYLTVVDVHRDQAVSIGANVTNRVDVRSSVSDWLRYQWFKDGTVVPSATTTNLVVTNFQSGDVGIYTFAVTNYAVTNQGHSPLVAFFDALLSIRQSDTDGDGMPNWFEDRYNFLNGVNDAGDDSDGDRISNINEYRSGTDPRDAQNFLRIEISNVGGVLLQFMAISNRSYSILYRHDVDGPSWQHLQSFGMVATNRLETYVDPVDGSERYYRLVTPRQP